jgi:hypothetical protein
MKIMKTIKSILFISLLFGCISCSDDDDSTTSFVDLKAEELSYSLVSKSSPTTGVIRISGKIKNIGNANFSSTIQQQHAAIYERVPGTTTEVEEIALNFTTMSAGEENTFFYDKNWDTTIEFQPEFILRIVMDPDITLDGNLNNDDVNFNNHQIILQGNEINSLFN